MRFDMSDCPRMNGCIGLSCEDTDKFAQVGKTRVVRVAANVAGINLLYDHRDFEQAETVEKECVLYGTAGFLLIARHQFAPGQAAGSGGGAESRQLQCRR